MSRGLLIIDVQNDFCPGGALACDHGDQVATLIGAYQRAHRHDYQVQVTTQDWHIDPGDHFSDDPDYFNSWPRHCVVGTGGAELHPGVDTTLIDAHFLKGEYSAAYSGFEGHLADSDTSLADWLKEQGVEELDVVGIATDYCVKASVLDALANGFKVTVFSDLIAGVSKDSSAAALDEMEEAGATIVASDSRS